MSRLGAISDNEWLVMELLWKQGEQKSAAIETALKGSKGWANTTIRTFLTRLIQKGVVAARQDDNDKRAYWYYPTITKEAYIAEQTKGHMKRYYAGNLPQMVAGLLKDENISEAELKEIERMLARVKRED